jgi:hypothetical protein
MDQMSFIFVWQKKILSVISLFCRKHYKLLDEAKAGRVRLDKVDSKHKMAFQRAIDPKTMFEKEKAIQLAETALAPEALARIEQEVAAELFKVHERGFDNLMVFLMKGKNRANGEAALQLLKEFHELVGKWYNYHDNKGHMTPVAAAVGQQPAGPEAGKGKQPLADTAVDPPGPSASGRICAIHECLQKIHNCGRINRPLG